MDKSKLVQMALYILLSSALPTILTFGIFSLPAIVHMIILAPVMWLVVTGLPNLAGTLADLDNGVEEDILNGNVGFAAWISFVTIRTIVLHNTVKFILEWTLGFQFHLTLNCTMLLWKKWDGPVSTYASIFCVKCLDFVDRGTLWGEPIPLREILKWRLEQATPERRKEVRTTLRAVGRLQGLRGWDVDRVLDIYEQWVSDVGSIVRPKLEGRNLDDCDDFFESLPEEELQLVLQLSTITALVLDQPGSDEE